MKYIVYISLLILTFSSGFGQTLDNISVINKLEKVNPGSYFSIFIEVKRSLLDSFPEYKGEMTVPKGWSILSEKKIESENSVRFMYTVSTPKTATSGRYELDFRLSRNGQALIVKPIITEVLENYSLEVISLSQTDFVKEGDTLITPFLVQNSGNTTEKIGLKTSIGFIYNVDDTLVIGPNSSKVVRVKQLIPVTDQVSWQVTADLSVSPQKHPRIYQAISVPVYSDKFKKNDRFLRMPIKIGLNYLNYNLGGDIVNGYQYDISAMGYLDSDNKHFMDLVVRGPNNISFPGLGSYDQYSLKYQFKSSSSLSVGDYLLRFSNLMEFGRFGRGLKFEQKFEKTDFLLFYQKARFFPNQKDSFGGSFGLNFNQENKVAFNYMSKKIVKGTNEFYSNLIGVSGKIAYKTLDIESEVSVGQANRKYDFGVFNKVHLSLGKLTLHNEVIKAGKNYFGFYTNSNLLLNSATLQIGKKLNIGVNSNFSRINPSLDINIYASSPFSKLNSAFVTFQPNTKNMFLLNYTEQEREDRQEPSTYHYKESFGNLTYTLNSSRINIFSQSRIGESINLLAKDFARSRRSYSFQIQPEVAVLPWFWIGGYAEYQHTNKFSNDNTVQDLFYYGGNVRLNYKQFVSLNLMVRNNYAPDQFFERRSFANGSLVFDFKGQSLALTGGRAYIPFSTTSNQNSSFFSITYTVKLNAPVGRNKNIGNFNGRLTSLNQGVLKKGIVMQLGPYRTLTDSLGNFHFNNILPSDYILSIPSTVELVGVKPEIKTPIEVTIKSDSLGYIEIPLVKTGGIEGVLDLKISDKYSYTKEDKNLPIVLAKLSNDNESYVTRVNKENTYSFKEMKPGNWKLEVYIPGNQEEYVIPNNELNVSIEPEKIENVNFTIMSIERKVRYTGQEFHVSSNK